MWYTALYKEWQADAQKISPKSGRGLGHVIPTIFGSTVGYPSDSLASCLIQFAECGLDICCYTVELMVEGIVFTVWTS